MLKESCPIDNSQRTNQDRITQIKWAIVDKTRNRDKISAIEKSDFSSRVIMKIRDLIS